MVILDLTPLKSFLARAHALHLLYRLDKSLVLRRGLLSTHHGGWTACTLVMSCWPLTRGSGLLLCFEDSSLITSKITLKLSTFILMDPRQRRVFVMAIFVQRCHFTAVSLCFHPFTRLSFFNSRCYLLPIGQFPGYWCCHDLL